MAERDLPPILGVSDMPAACERVIGSSPCGARAVFHIIWDETVRNGSACEEHALEAIKRWEPWKVHKLTAPCITKGARFDPEQNYCFMPDEPLTVEGALQKAADLLPVEAGRG